MMKLVRFALGISCLLGLPAAAEGQVEEMLGGIRSYLLQAPVLQGKLPSHPYLLEADRCEAAKPREIVVLLTYRILNCKAYPGALVIAPRLIHPERRERVRRMGYPFAQVPLGFELAAYYDAVRKYKVPVRLDPPLDRLFGVVEKPRPQENAFQVSIRRHDERLVERSTQDTSKIENYLAGLIGVAEGKRTALLTGQGAKAVAQKWFEEVSGRLAPYDGPFRLRERTVAEGEGWVGLSISIDALPGVIAQGVLLKPIGLREFERRPLLILQHGLGAKPESLFGQSMDTADYRLYRNFAERMVAEGYVVFCPQGWFAGDFRSLQLLAQPRGLSLSAFAGAQLRRMLNYLEKLTYIDRTRMVYYGFDYGGGVALRAAVFEPRFRAIVCAGNFSDWVRKLIGPSTAGGYLSGEQYEIYDWNLAQVSSHAELAAMAALLHERPIPLLVERGHRGRMAEDEWVEAEFARLKGYVRDPMLRQLAYFDGENRIDGKAAIAFFKEALKDR